jgi:zinc protease
LLSLISVCYSQPRQVPRRYTPGGSRAQFLQHAKSYEETPYVTRVEFRNGLTALVNEYRSEPVVSLQAYVLSGYSNEPPEGPGTASLLAAMTYRGGESQSCGTFRQSAQTLGGFFRRSAQFEYTRFEIVTASSQWKRAMNLQAEALLNPSFDQNVLKLEANHLTNEARAVLDDPLKFAREKLLVLAFNQPRMVNFGTLASGALAHLVSKELYDFYKARYVPAEITLVVSGDVRSSEVLNEIDRVYDKFSRSGGKKSTLAVGSAQKEFRYSAIRGNISFPRVLFGFHTVAKNSEDYRAMEVLTAILGFGKGSVITRRLRDQKKLIFRQQTALKTYPDFGYLVIQMVVDSENIDRSEIAALTEIELLKRNGPNEIEMARAVSQLEHDYWKRLETVTGRAQMLAEFELLGDWKRMDRYVAELRKVKASDVKRVANRYLQLLNCSVLEYLPNTGVQRDLTTESILNTLEGLIEPSANEEEAKRAREVVNADELPAANDTFKFSEIRYPFQLASILRGPEMFVREDHTSPLIDLGIFFPGGKLFETKENAGITELMVNLMLGESGDPNKSQFHRNMEILGGRVQPRIADDYFGYQYSILSRNFEAGFDLLRQAIKAPDFDKDKIARQKEIQSAWIQEGGNCVSYPEELINRALFNNYSYSMNGRGTEASLAAITQDAVQKWYDTYVKNRKPVVVAIGDTKGTSLASHFVQNFSGSRMQSTEISDEYVRPLGKGENLEENWGNSQNLIFIGFQAPPEDDVDGYAATVLQDYAGELGRFAQDLRDRMGTAFDVSANYDPRLRGGSFIIRAAANPGNEEDVCKTLREEIKGMTANPIPRLDFRSALNAAASGYSIRNQVRSRQIEDIVESVLAGRGIEGYENYSAGLKDVGEEEFEAVARRILNLDKAVILQLHSQSK